MAQKVLNKKKYIFNEELQFFKKIYEQTETTDSFVIEKENKEKNDSSCHQSPENTQHEVSLTNRTKD